jgi:hypothetical protein
MAKHIGGEVVRNGFYLDWRGWKFEVVEGESGALPGSAETAYVRVPTLLMLVLAPILGGLFVVFLPFIGFALIGERAWTALRTSVRRPERPAETKVF